MKLITVLLISFSFLVGCSSDDKKATPCSASYIDAYNELASDIAYNFIKLSKVEEPSIEDVAQYVIDVKEDCDRFTGNYSRTLVCKGEVEGEDGARVVKDDFSFDSSEAGEICKGVEDTFDDAQKIKSGKSSIFDIQSVVKDMELKKLY